MLLMRILYGGAVISSNRAFSKAYALLTVSSQSAFSQELLAVREERYFATFTTLTVLSPV